MSGVAEVTAVSQRLVAQAFALEDHARISDEAGQPMVAQPFIALGMATRR